MQKKCLVVCGPSGAGLGEIVKRVFALRSDVAAVTPVTARKPKAGEQDGVGFWFYDLEGWNALKESGDLLEATEFAGNDYGTSRRLVNAALEQGHNVLLNLPVERVDVNETGALGCAITAAAGCGDYPSLSEAAKAMSPSGSRLLPDENAHACYMRRYALYKKLIDCLDPLWDDVLDCM